MPTPATRILRGQSSSSALPVNFAVGRRCCAAHFLIPILALFVFCCSTGALAAELNQSYDREIRPLLKQYCLGCHSAEKHKGDLDLERFASARDVLKHPKSWQTVIDQLSLGEMPPKEKQQPTAQQREKLIQWANDALDEAATARAGDPGPVVLRRLNNAEYNFTVRDLTGVSTLDETKEFPADSAAGEGFMNTGNALVMSPALLTKYLDAGKDIASHAVLLPDGFRFSSKTTRRDWTEEILADIRALYRRYTDQRGAEKVNLQGIVFDTNEGGRLPVEQYIETTIALRRELQAGGADAVAKEAALRALNAKYLGGLWAMLNNPQSSLILDRIRAHWREATPAAADTVSSEIRDWQKALWKFSSVGHIGKAGGPKAWMEPVNPIVTKQDFKIKLIPPANSDEVTLYLSASDAGDGNRDDLVIWQSPKLVAPGRPNLLLKDAPAYIEQMTRRRERLFSSTKRCLEAAATASEMPGPLHIEELASRFSVEAEDLRCWLQYLGIGGEAVTNLNHLTGRIEKSAGYDFVSGWGRNETPLLLANSSTQHVRIPGNQKGHGVTMHPSPTLNVAAGWQAPGPMSLRVAAEITHAHPECGNGVEWFVEVRRGNTRQRLARGTAQGTRKASAGPFENIRVQKGDLVSVLIGPRDGNHACDLTDVEFTLSDGTREWSLTRDVSANILAGNPHSDAFGNAGVWHFYTEPVSGRDPEMIPAGSLLARWQSAPAAEKPVLAGQLQELLLSPNKPEAGPDLALFRQLGSLTGPLLASLPVSAAPQAARKTLWGLAAKRFGKLPDGTKIDDASLAVQAPSIVEIKLPADLVAGTELVASATLQNLSNSEGSVQLQVTTTKPGAASGLLPAETKVAAGNGPWTSDNRQVSHTSPILVAENSAARPRLERAFDEFRQWFPTALCYVKIVPVDEVVTLTLFYREDHHLMRLMLDDAEQARLNRLWEELHFISQDALTLVDAFEQLWQYATQDADPKVFEPMRKPIQDRAAAFRQQVKAAEPAQLGALLQFAERAYRRPLEGSEKEQLRSLYMRLRTEEIPHEEALRLTLARLFVSPAFLYRLEKAAPGEEPGPVSNYELANRLSYFLWSSMPDAELLRAAKAGSLQDPKVLAAQARRLLQEPKVRRLATEFGCAWLHIHDFASLDEKSEKHFPTFAPLREPMYEEAIQLFTDLFQRDASILRLLDADYTFLNDKLAQHYGIPGVTGPEWRKVEGVKRYARGGILGLSATLAKQSGASRTSPILRGNWVAEVLLGDKLPRPPKDVPRLPEDEAAETKTVRELVERHSSDPRCSGCHQRIDGFGFALEGFDAIGRARTNDLAGRAIQTRTKVFDGTELEGIQGLRDYLLNQKRDIFVRHFCRKLLGYALGRGIMLSDKPLLNEMERQLRSREYRFSAAIETIVRSKQFREIRGKGAAELD